MKKTVLRNGVISIIVIIIFGCTSTLLNSKYGNMHLQEILGYISIFLSLIFVFFGIKQYRDKVNNGSVSYLKALWLGILITLFPSFAFGLFDVIYVHIIDPGFIDKYVAAATKEAQSLPADKQQAVLTNIKWGADIMRNPVTDFGLMFCTVLPIGIVVSAISALILYRKPKNA